MGEAKPTPGPCWVDAHMNVISSAGLVAFPGCSAGFDQKKNANLIAEAFNVQLTTGLTPSQLVERVKELEEAAKLVLDWYEAENDHSKTDFYQRVQMCRDSEDALRAALSKARPNTAEGEAHGRASAGAAPGRVMNESAERKAAHEGYEKRITRISERNPHDEGMYTLGWWDCAWNAAHPTTTAQAYPAAAKEPSP